jgi:hypothetical protein
VTKSICGYRGDPVCEPPTCSGACPPGNDTRPVRDEHDDPLFIDDLVELFEPIRFIHSFNYNIYPLPNYDYTEELQ